MRPRERSTRRRATSFAAFAAVAAAAIALGATHGCGGGSSGSQSPTEALNAARNEKLSQILRWIGEGVAVPEYEAMSAEFRDLDGAAKAFCADRSAEHLEALRGAWRDGIGAWVEVSSIQFGPIKTENYELRIEFWPDANNNVTRSVAQLLARTDPIDEQYLAGQSVAAQGLSAIEYLSFDGDADGDALALFKEGAAGDRRCALVSAAAANLRTMGDQLATAWRRDGGGWVDQLVRAGQDSTAFATRDAAIEEVVNSMVAAVELTKNNRVVSPLGASPAEAIATRAESFRSGASLANVERSLRGLRRMFQGEVTAGYSFDNYLREIHEIDLTRNVFTAFDDSEDRVASIPVPLTEAIFDEHRPQVDSLAEALTRLTRLIKNDLAAAMQVTVGFNDNDGD